MPDTGLLCLGVTWFLSSALLSTYANTAFLIAFGDPLAHTLVRFAGSAFIGLATNARATKDYLSVGDLQRLLRDFRAPAFCLLVANGMNSVALQASGITLCYVVKSTIPFFTVLLMSFGFSEHYEIQIYMSLVPIVGGAALASLSDSSFSMVGLGAALCSTAAQTLLNVSSKQAVRRSNITGQQAQMVMAIACALACFPLYILYGAWAGTTAVFTSALGAALNGDVIPLGLAVLAAVAYHTEYLLNFVFVEKVAPLEFSVTDIARRVAIIGCGAAMFHKPLFPINMIGITIALAGVLWYSVLNQQNKTQLKPV